jgi:hypothetical protein
MSCAGDRMAQYDKRVASVGRTRFDPGNDAKTETDPSLPKVWFYRYPDGSMIRKDHTKGYVILEEC